MGNPDPSAISTSYIERMNLTLRMGTQRMTRSTNAHSKRVLQHACAVALLLFYYNFIRTHESLREPFRERTPAMAIGLTEQALGVRRHPEPRGRHCPQAESPRPLQETGGY